MSTTGDARMTFGGHLEVMRRMLMRILAVVTALAVALFCLKDAVFRLLLAPKEWDFVTYRAIERAAQWAQGAWAAWTGGAAGAPFRFEPYSVELISTELSAQFMMHLTASAVLAVLLASPYVLWELFRFVSPALYEHERRHSAALGVAVYALFAVGVAMNYFVIFPISFRFLGTYQVDASIANTITLESYVTTFATLTFVMGLVFQLPVLALVLGRLGLLSAGFMRRYRRHAAVLVLVAAAIITPPDVFTLVLVAVPLYLLYEACILIVQRVGRE